jgi:hypothetical protein
MRAGTPPFCDFDKAKIFFAYLKAKILNVSNIEQTYHPNPENLWETGASLCTSLRSERRFASVTL